MLSGSCFSISVCFSFIYVNRSRTCGDTPIMASRCLCHLGDSPGSVADWSLYELVLSATPPPPPLYWTSTFSDGQHSSLLATQGQWEEPGGRSLIGSFPSRELMYLT